MRHINCCNIRYSFYSEVRNAAIKVADKLFQAVHTAVTDTRKSVDHMQASTSALTGFMLS